MTYKKGNQFRSGAAACAGPRGAAAAACPTRGRTARGGSLRAAAGARAAAGDARAGSDLGVSRRLVVDAYAQLLAEGYLLARRGAGTFVADTAGALPVPRDGADPRPSLSTSSPAIPTSLRSRGVRGRAPCARRCARRPTWCFGYPDPQGAPELRAALAAHLRRVRGVVADPGRLWCAPDRAGVRAVVMALGGYASPSRIRACRCIGRSLPRGARSCTARGRREGAR